MESLTLPNQEERSLQPSPFTIGRRTGFLLLLQLIAALTLPFILSSPITVGSPAFLTDGVEHAFQIRMAVLLSFAGAALTVYLGIVVFQIFRQYSNSVAILFIVVCAISCILDLVHGGTILSMLHMSHQYVTSGSVNSDLYQAVGAAVVSVNRSAHIIQLLAIGVWMCVFYISLLRFQLIPLWLAGLGILGVALQFTGVTLMLLLGYRVIGEMAMPLLPIQITVAVWLIIKGFRGQLPV